MTSLWYGMDIRQRTHGSKTKSRPCSYDEEHTKPLVLRLCLLVLRNELSMNCQYKPSISLTIAQVQTQTAVVVRRSPIVTLMSEVLQARTLS